LDARAQLDAFIDRFSPEVATDARRALAVLEARLPTATRLVYDNYNALVIGFGPSDRASQAFLSIALYPKYVRIFFLRGVDLPDPQGLLEGNGSQVRSVKLQPITLIETPGVRSLIDCAVAGVLASNGKGALVIKSISTKQRSRRPGV
jgi:hypothetical protein